MHDLDIAICDLDLTSYITCLQKSLQVARLNLMAGESCIKASSFHSAADYFTNGIKLLPGECWECEYNLTVKLHDAAQDAVFATGDFPTLGLLNSRVIANAKNFDDKLNSCEWLGCALEFCYSLHYFSSFVNPIFENR